MYLRKFVFAGHIFVLKQSLQVQLQVQCNALPLAYQSVVLNCPVFRTFDPCDLVSMTNFKGVLSTLDVTSQIAVKGLVGLGDRTGSDTCLSGLGQQLSAQCY